MKLYKIHIQYWGKDLDSEDIAGYEVHKNEEDMYKSILEWIGMDPEELEEYEGYTKEELMKNKGDTKTEYLGEFYDVKYRWEEVCEISVEEITTLKKLEIL